MEVRIRLQKIGKRARTNYRVVAISRQTARDGKHLEILGYYDPAHKPAQLSLKKDKIEKWIKQGAVLSDTVRSLLSKAK